MVAERTGNRTTCNDDDKRSRTTSEGTMVGVTKDDRDPIWV